MTPGGFGPPEQGTSAQRSAGANTRDNAFLNVPYDRLYLALSAGLSAFGLFPRATIELTGSQRRLDRIIRLLGSCQYSFHDLSRVGLDRTPPATPRFNMPFELGLAVSPRHGMRHEWFVFEAHRHRLTKSLSDLNGTDPHVHDGDPHRLLRALTNALVRRRHRPTAAQLDGVYEDVRRMACRLRHGLRTDSLYEARAFDQLVMAGRMSAERRRGRQEDAVTSALNRLVEAGAVMCY